MRACLDACVLVPTALRGILLRLAEVGAFEPIWSDRIFEEWRRADLRIHPEAERSLGVTQALLKDKYRSAMIAADPTLEAQIALPDPNDAHVLATAVTGKADVLVTANLRDFPQSAMARFGIGLRHPDAFLLAIFENHEADIRSAIDQEWELAKAATGEAFTKKAFLKRISLPRIAKRVL
ncbi:MAG: PIN domain-containing protein [Pseudomonadota bacterium]